ncbi:class I SAM-dependent methyltransferase [Cognatiyoonia sp. IB215182]|uniref:class I SAM-dependent methyltransferase n=1 Tax=Cognatiyoonia sp. IB215182 TaxID=3097353 RepID=UPI002A0F2896|nr:methyltransferase domain-containing protein [Cognatiyoonia sp. IB215182]MDX8351730.1 methyltransferase domain-containing protein [Cognatiyoonia sp. IB215182]
MSNAANDARAPAGAWDAHADDYMRLFSPLTGHIARGMVALVQSRLPDAPCLLDIACGPGDLAVAAATLCAERDAGSVLATDISPRMVALTQRALQPIDADARAEVRDGQDLGLESASFDAALSCFGIFLFPDRVAGWRTAAETLRPGGLFATSVWRGPESNELAKAQMGPLMSALPARLTNPPPRASWADLMTAEGLVDEITRAAPLIDPEIHILDATLALPTPNAMWRGMVGNPITGALIAACTHEEREDVERAVLAAFENRSGGPDLPFLLNTSCHVLIARRA